MGTPSHCKNVFVKKLHIPKNDKYVSRLYWTKQNNYNKHVFLSPINSPHWRFQSRYTEMPDVVDRCQRWSLTAVRFSSIFATNPDTNPGRSNILVVHTNVSKLQLADCHAAASSADSFGPSNSTPICTPPSLLSVYILQHFTTFYYILLHFTFYLWK